MFLGTNSEDHPPNFLRILNFFEMFCGWGGVFRVARCLENTLRIFTIRPELKMTDLRT